MKTSTCMQKVMLRGVCGSEGLLYSRAYFFGGCCFWRNKKSRLYFDRLAPQWDVQCCHSASAIERILSLVQIGQGDHVLDVGCGTESYFPYYLSHGVSSLLGVDLSPEMISFAKKKVSDPRVSLVCADAETYPVSRRFHQCMIYSAFPHFPNPDALLKIWQKRFLPNGRITVAHSEGRKTIDMRHLEGARGFPPFRTCRNAGKAFRRLFLCRYHSRRRQFLSSFRCTPYRNIVSA